jgi:hypothetical protein
MDPALIDSLADVGFAGGLILILIGGFRGWWIYGPLHDRQIADLTADKMFWRNMALGSLRVADRVSDAIPPAGEDVD